MAEYPAVIVRQAVAEFRRRGPVMRGPQGQEVAKGVTRPPVTTEKQQTQPTATTCCKGCTCHQGGK